jgi:ABC-2 type transport system ATP-binding protein
MSTALPEVPEIAVDGLVLRYGSVTALDGLTFTLPGGRIYGLLGRNGAGKTSLLSVLAGFRRASGGDVRIGGEPVFENRRATRQVCLIHGTGFLGGSGDRVSEALDTARALRPAWDEEYAAALLDRFGVDRRAKISTLSRGKQSALGIAVGLASRTPITMFDESYLGMDAPSRQAFIDELLAELTARPRTVILSTHLVEEMGRLFEEVLIIDGGRLVVRDDADALRSRGAAVTGPAEAVDRFVDGLTVLGERHLGRTKSATVYGALDGASRQRADAAGLELGPVGLQDLFIHLTEPSVAGGPQ